MALMIQKVWNQTLTVLALAFLVAFSYPAFNTDISDSTQTSLDLIQWISWAAFASDLLYGLSTAKNKKSFKLVLVEPLIFLARVM
jgi:voltage-gated potassium channel